MKRNSNPVESHTFAGMETAVELQSKAAAVYTAEELTKRLLEPGQSISKRAGEMERNAPLFHGTGDNPSLF
jgi:4-aminobutyrate aminotransferase-like enzyme